jgi:hypothetical protein
MISGRFTLFAAVALSCAALANAECTDLTMNDGSVWETKTGESIANRYVTRAGAVAFKPFFDLAAGGSCAGFRAAFETGWDELYYEYYLDHDTGYNRNCPNWAGPRGALSPKDAVGVAVLSEPAIESGADGEPTALEACCGCGGGADAVDGAADDYPATTTTTSIDDSLGRSDVDDQEWNGANTITNTNPCTPDDNYANCGCEHASCSMHTHERLGRIVKVRLYSDTKHEKSGERSISRMELKFSLNNRS